MRGWVERRCGSGGCPKARLGCVSEQGMLARPLIRAFPGVRCIAELVAQCSIPLYRRQRTLLCSQSAVVPCGRVPPAAATHLSDTDLFAANRTIRVWHGTEERGTTPKRPRRTCIPRFGLRSNQRDWPFVVKRPRELHPPESLFDQFATFTSLYPLSPLLALSLSLSLTHPPARGGSRCR